ncbi:YggS family pyridoxal phosphate-dependent enzyme [Tumebacillus algifaecis]|uniref:Pyridoxal phosphate homeostasis protein n=1 Tax=Tumebacillus algifaecis TaxID=1214604 RepID=A0A223D2T3_9BACL|nr:YggS family pyridoxal phosphate-dependent enzyme [Tumebacillus algifaecis]ASS75841.1 YggS family pyridoxal phosphate-dependent enzyme [Tumebacillus algifaecis]
MEYEKRLAELKERIAQACARAGRDQDEVTIVGVTKYVGVEETKSLIEAGLRDLGENRIAVAAPKLEAIPEEFGVRWHFIGHLQTNKAKDVIGRFSLIHSVDRLSLAKEINKRAEVQGITVPCLVQVNVSGEDSKGGFAPEELIGFLTEAQAMKGLDLRGLMTMAPATDDAETVRPVFRGLRELRDNLLARGYLPAGSNELSMGMSGDFEVAIEEGATFVRIGSVLVKP